MKTNCKNCEALFTGNYCNHCGQPAHTHRIDAHYLWEDVEHGLLHYDKGIGYSLKRLFTKPGKEIRNYIIGKRVGHFKPISLSIVLATAYALVYHFTGVKIMDSANKESVLFLEKIMGHYYWYVLLTIPVFAFATKTAFQAKSFNFAELIVFEAFKSSQRLLVHILFLPVLLLFHSAAVAVVTVNYLLLFIDFALILWTNITFFEGRSTTSIVWRTFLSYAIYTVCSIILLAVTMLTMGYFKV